MTTSGTRELYRSSNGDRWHLVRETDSGRVLIKHQPNTASGGRTSYVEIAEFLTGGHGPEHQALLELIGTLVVAPGRGGWWLSSAFPMPPRLSLPSAFSSAAHKDRGRGNRRGGRRNCRRHSRCRGTSTRCPRPGRRWSAPRRSSGRRCRRP